MTEENVLNERIYVNQVPNAILISSDATAYFWKEWGVSQ